MIQKEFHYSTYIYGIKAEHTFICYAQKEIHMFLKIFDKLFLSVTSSRSLDLIIRIIFTLYLENFDLITQNFD